MPVRTRTLLVAGAVLALAGCGATVQAPRPVGQAATASPQDRLIAAVEAEGCVLTSANVAAVLLRANLTQAELVPLTEQLAGAGRAEVSGEGSIRILSDNCI